MPTSLPESTSIETKTIRVVSWNIHGAIGRGGKPDQDRTLTELFRLAPDIVVLQEVDERTALGRPADQFDFFRKGLSERLLGDSTKHSDHAVDVRTAQRANCVCGNLVWSRFAIRSSTVFDLPGPDIETRKVIDVVVDAGHRDLRVLGTHFALLPMTRLRQARTVVEQIRNGDSPASMAKLLLGDLNEWSPIGWVHGTLSRALPNAYAPRSWPERFPIAPLDRVYASADVEITHAFVDRKAARASDHCPIVVDIRF